MGVAMGATSEEILKVPTGRPMPNRYCRSKIDKSSASNPTIRAASIFRPWLDTLRSWACMSAFRFCRFLLAFRLSSLTDSTPMNRFDTPASAQRTSISSSRATSIETWVAKIT